MWDVLPFMNPERVETSLRFLGDWPWWAGASVALLLGGGAWMLYRRDTARGWLRMLLPTLRAAVVALIVIMLSGPVLHHRKIIGQLSQLFLFVDGSKSMELSDPAMEPGRKVLILQRLGLLPEGVVKMELPTAIQALADAQTLAESAGNPPPEEQRRKLGADFFAKIETARDALIAAQLETPRQTAFQSELVEPARALRDDRSKTARDLVPVLARWRAELQETFQRSIADQTASETSPLRDALAKFDNLPRTQRLRSMLLEGEQEKLLASLAEKYDVQLLDLRDAEAKKIWQPTSRDSALPTSLPKAGGEVTNLATGIKSVAARDEKTRGAMVLLSDGQHNAGESPLEVAKILAGRQMPVFTVGFGSEVRPRDLAVVKTEVPDSVFFEDRARGQITLKDDMPTGQAFTVSIKDGETVLWEQRFATEGKNLRKIPFEFPVSEQVKQRLKAQSADVQLSSVPLELQVSVSQLEGDREPANNAGSLRLRALTQKRKVLLLDGRPRWETRYLRNLYERDEQWEVNAVIAGTTAGESGWPRGPTPGTFPADAALLASYDLVIFGEVPRSVFKDDELTWLRDFVANRGGALVFIDGPRERLKEYADTALGPLFPVEWKSSATREGITRLVLAERAATLAPFTLASDAAQNPEVWRNLQAPHWIAGATALPSAETLVEAEVGDERRAAVISRPFGAGKVLYQAFEDSWRWRYEVADEHHVRYWNQLANWLAELPFAARDKFVSLDAGAITYHPGDSAELRVRLRDGEGRPVTNTVVDAVLTRDGKKVATIRLSADENSGGLFRGRTAALAPGAYEVSVESAAIAERDSKARVQFKVEPRETGELTQLSLNEELLRQIAATTGGEYLREENIHRLKDLLAPLSEGRVVESDTVLWQSWWWFLPIVLLLTIEWMIRKRVGML